jgi:hypothetical protein
LESRRVVWGGIRRDAGRPTPKIPAASRRSRTAGKTRQWIEDRSKPLNVQRQKHRPITERLARGVKGLTARFDVLLVTVATVRPPPLGARNN